MAINITVYPLLSPRIIVIDSPTTSASIQEIVDAIREWEDSTTGMEYEYLIDAAGKEDLGGGVTVAITAQLNNAKIMFESRRTIISTGTVTTGDTTGFLLTDSAADFVTDGVELGAEIHNVTDGSSCCVIEVTSSTELLTDYLAGGTDDQFDIGDSYVVWNQEVCEIYGGNLVAVDDVGASMEPVVPSFGTYVKVAAASSATLVDAGGGLTLGGIADAVWDETLADHLGAGSTGEGLSTASAPTAGEVADAVWDEAIADHTGPTTFGGSVATKDDLDALNTIKTYVLQGAGDITVGLGSIGSGDYISTQTHDESYLEIVETATGYRVDFTFTAEADDIPRYFQFQGRYQGNPAHVVRVQAYNHETSAFEYIVIPEGSDSLESSTTDYFKEFIINRDHINPATNEVIIRIEHTNPGNVAHRLWIDKINVIASLASLSLTEEGIAGAVWEELVADHTTADTMGEQAQDTLKKAKLAAFKL